MARISVSEEYGVQAEEMWRRLSDFGRLAGRMPGIERCDAEGGGIGADRIAPALEGSYGRALKALESKSEG